MPRPIDTIIIDVRLVLRPRSGRHTPASNSVPTSAETATASDRRRDQVQPERWLNHQATIAPKVTISPWAKFDRPVVP